MSRRTRRFKSGDEAGRKCALDRLNILDTEPEPEFEKVTDLITTCLDVPIATVSLIDSDRQWFKSMRGINAQNVDREDTFCTHTIKSDVCLVINDVRKDPRFSSNPFVMGEPHVRAYLGVPLLTPDGYAVGTICAIDVKVRDFTAHDIAMMEGFAKIIMNELELRTLASTDFLTKLATRRTFVTALQELMDKNTPTALLFADLDRFKDVNDTLGHPVGDDILRATGHILIWHCPENGMAARLGGEELALVLPLTDGAAATAKAEAIRKSISEIRLPDHPELHCTVSVGVALSKDYSTIDDWMAAADDALYWAKDNGRDRVATAFDTKRDTDAA
ncbi:MAG: sensor domain-containing diguanylate cyclase [Pseudomonadota bacterium]